MKTIEFKVMVWLRSIREQHAAEAKENRVEERVADYRRRAQALQHKLQKEKVAA
jgi:C4-dicarboxylate-specific signal transduction histidine kinase